MVAVAVSAAGEAVAPPLDAFKLSAFDLWTGFGLPDDDTDYN